MTRCVIFFGFFVRIALMMRADCAIKRLAFYKNILTRGNLWSLLRNNIHLGHWPILMYDFFKTPYLRKMGQGEQSERTNKKDQISFLPALHIKASPVCYQDLLFFLLNASFQGGVVAGIGRVADDCCVSANKQIGIREQVGMNSCLTSTSPS